MIYLAVLVFAMALWALSQNAPRIASGCGFILAIVLMAFAGLRGDSTDYEQYEVIFGLMKDAGDVDWWLRILIGKDPLFGSLMLLVITAGLSSQWLFVSAAVLGIGTKWAAFNRAYGAATAPLLATLFGYYFLHDFTQIRAGIALGFCFVSLVLKCEGGHNRAAFVWGLLAVGFHASAALYLMLMWVVTLQPRRAWIFSLMIVALLLLGARAESALVSSFDDRTDPTLDTTGSSITPLLIAGVRLAILVWIWYDLRKRSEDNARLLQASIILCAVAVPMLIVLRGLSAIMAFRFYELLDAFSVFLLGASLARGSTASRLVSLALCVASILVHMHNDLIPAYVFGTF